MEFQAPDINLWTVLPLLVVGVTALAVLLLGVLPDQPGVKRPLTVSLSGLLVAAGATKLMVFVKAPPSFGGMLLSDVAAAVFGLMFLSAAAVAIVLAADHLVSDGAEAGECFALLLLATVGMMLMASGGHLVIIFLGLEMMSIALYILSGLAGSWDRGSNEAALKYLLLGGFATGFLLYGMAFLYGGTGTLHLATMKNVVSGGGAEHGFLNLGLGLVTIGLGFKVALVPFHMWAPDVYEGAPAPVTAFMSVGAKVAGFAAILRLFDVALVGVADVWRPTWTTLSVLTMVVGNITALSQTSVKRMLAYSSIAHAGYLAVGVAAGAVVGMQAVIYYAWAYTFMNLGAFVVVTAVGAPADRLVLNDLKGLAKRSPGYAAAMALFMFALTGIPPLSGFVGKWLLLVGAVEANLLPLAVVMVLASAVGAFYYLRVVVFMYMSEPLQPDERPVEGCCCRWALRFCVLLTILLSWPIGLWIMGYCDWAAKTLAGG